MNNKQSILVTGIPRSGTSLLMKLLSANDRNICLSEPSFIKGIKHSSKTDKEVSISLQEEIKKIRVNIKNNIPIELRIGKDNLLPDNYFIRSKLNGNQKIKTAYSFTKFKFPQNFHKNRIYIKNNLLFTSCLKELKYKFNIVAIIRNPISVIGSWNSLNLPISKGNVKSGLPYSASLRKINQIEKLLIKQIKIIDWFFYRYKDLLPSDCLIRYEDLIEEPRECLKRWLGTEQETPFLVSRNQSSYYSYTDEILETIKCKSILYNELYSLN